MLKPQVPILGAKTRGSGWEGRGTSTQRGYGPEWRKLREAVMRRDCGLCQPCSKVGKVARAYAVDHIVNKADGGSDDPANLQAICKPCHILKTADESTRARGGTPKARVRIGVDGWPVR